MATTTSVTALLVDNPDPDYRERLADLVMRNQPLTPPSHVNCSRSSATPSSTRCHQHTATACSTPTSGTAKKPPTCSGADSPSHDTEKTAKRSPRIATC